MTSDDLSKYDYDLPQDLVRKEGVEPRDHAKLLVYDTRTDTMRHDFFYNLANYLPKHSLLVVNDTRVLPARLHLKKETGGKIEVFILVNEWDPENGEIPLLVDRKCHIGWKLFFPNGYFFEIIRQQENIFFAFLNPSNSGSTPVKSLEELLEEFGETPIPPYLQRKEWSHDEKKLRSRYQTIFAEAGKSVAAPTAALHFTDDVFASLRKKNIDTVSVRLDVGLGTFAKLKDENFTQKKLHQEWIEISPETAEMINQVQQENRSIIAVGTTALRTLESCVKDGITNPFSGYTNIFISPPHHFQSADILITNFHLPKSSLMLLVEAFLRDKGAKRNLVELYRVAIKEGYAFYSFGDSMIIL